MFTATARFDAYGSRSSNLSNDNLFYTAFGGAFCSAKVYTPRYIPHESRLLSSRFFGVAPSHFENSDPSSHGGHSSLFPATVRAFVEVRRSGSAQITTPRKHPYIQFGTCKTKNNCCVAFSAGSETRTSFTKTTGRSFARRVTSRCRPRFPGLILTALALVFMSSAGYASRRFCWRG